MTRVLVSDTIPSEGIERLREAGFEVDFETGLSPQELLDRIANYQALVVRSGTKVTAEVIDAATDLKVIGRAGVGVDNIHLPSATKRGIVVMNTPGGSSVTVAEHTMAMILAMVRRIPAATASVKAGRWEKKRFGGRELAGKRLGVVGIGNIGSMVVERARAFGMSVIAYDPFTTAEAASAIGAELVELGELISTAEIISLHVPLTQQTRHLINAERLAQMRRGVYIVNCARGGVVDERALAAAIESGHVAGAALDVFETEPPTQDNPLLALENFVCAPHLGASTREAQAAVARQLADQVVAFFREGEIRNAVNGPSVSRELLDTLGPWLDLGTRLGEVAAQLFEGKPQRVTIDFSGEIASKQLTPLTNHALSGLLRRITADPVNAFNAPSLAKERGLIVSQTTSSQNEDYVSTIGVKLTGVDGAAQSVEAVGTVFGKRNPRIVAVNDFGIEAVPEGNLLVVRNEDVPNIVGQVGSILGAAEVNIGRIHLSRLAPRAQAFSLINVDSRVPEPVLDKLRAIPHMTSVTQIFL